MFFGGGARKPTGTQPIPFDKWTRYTVAATGQPYIVNPVTGETKWLYQRFHDSPTGRDYLVNIIDNKRVWATNANAYLCPPIVDTPPVSAAERHAKWSPADAAGAPARPDPVARPQPSGVGNGRPRNDNAGVGPEAQRQPSDGAPGRARPRPKEIQAPPSLGLGPDEALMMAPTSERLYIFNKRTKKSRWLPEGAAKHVAAAAPKTPNGLHPAASERAAGERGARASHTAADTAGHRPLDPARNGYTAPGAARAAASEKPDAPLASKTRGTGRVQAAAARFGGQARAPGSAAASDHAPAQPSSAARRGRQMPTKRSGLVDIQRLYRGFVTRKYGVLPKLRDLAAVAKDTKRTVSVGEKHDVQLLRRVVARSSRVGDENGITVKEANQRLLELGEYLTQRMLIVDGVDSGGDALVRRKRKETVKEILALIDVVDGLREQARKKS